MQRTNGWWIAAGWVVLIGASSAHGQWSGAQLLNLPPENGQGAIKKPDVCRAAAGGFHVVYRHHLNSGTVPMKYRRYLNGTLQPMVTAAVAPDYAWDEFICESGTGEIHISWEDWYAAANVGWTKSTNGGASFLPYSRITNFTASAKAPRIAPVGAANSSEIMLVVADPATKLIQSSRYNGSTWSPVTSTGFGYGTEYQIFGICRSPLDGSVYAGSNSSSGTYSLLRYTGYWSSTDVQTTGFYARQAVAVNEGGQVMVCWERDSGWYARLYTPTQSWGPILVVGSGGFGSVVAIPGTTSFYTAYSAGDSPSRIRGKTYANGSWGSEEVISVGLPDAQSLDPRVAVGTDGSMLCCWEYWPSGANAQAWYSVRQAPAAQPRGTIAGVVRDQNGAGVPGVGVMTSSGAAASTGSDGAYAISSPVGTFSATALKEDYTTQTVGNVAVAQNQTTTVNFVINAQPSASVASFVVIASTTQNLLQWINPWSTQYAGTRIVYRTDAFPTSATDGTLVVDVPAAPGSSRMFTHTGLTNGVTCYYAAFAYAQGGSRFYAPGVNAAATPAVRPDFDRDGDVDQSDFGLMQSCFSGAFIRQDEPNCAPARLDSDTDVDQDDLTALMGCYHGAGVYAPPNCSN